MKFSTFLIALLAMVSAFAFMSWQRLRIDIAADLDRHAVEINKNVPIVLNPHTDIIGAHVDGKEIVYQFRVHGLSADAMSTSKNLLRANKIQIAKEDKSIQRMLDKGATLTYEYFVGNDLALRFSIEKASVES